MADTDTSPEASPAAGAAADAACKAEKCDKSIRAKGYCDRHYRAWRKGKLGKPRHPSCNETGCGKAPLRRGLCPEHFGKHYGKKTEGEAAAK
jgi:hypothetical protein